MKIKHIDKKIEKREIEKFKKNISEYMCSLMSNFLPESSVELFKSHLNDHRFDSVIESIISKIFQFARGELKLNTKEEKWMMRQACDTICTILWRSPADNLKNNINWTEWVKTPLGFAIKACYARLKDEISCEELGIMLGYTRQEISRRAKLNLIPHKVIAGSYVFSKKDLFKKNIITEN